MPACACSLASRGCCLADPTSAAVFGLFVALVCHCCCCAAQLVVCAGCRFSSAHLLVCHLLHGPSRVFAVPALRARAKEEKKKIKTFIAMNKMSVVRCRACSPCALCGMRVYLLKGFGILMRRWRVLVVLLFVFCLYRAVSFVCCLDVRSVSMMLLWWSQALVLFILLLQVRCTLN